MIGEVDIESDDDDDDDDCKKFLMDEVGVWVFGVKRFFIDWLV